MNKFGLRDFCCFWVLVMMMIVSPVWAKFPERPITMIAPFGAGGGSDLASRIIAAGMSKDLGQPMIIEYKPGAGGALAIGALLKAPADGHTILIGSATPLVLAPLTNKVDYTLDDFKLIGTFACIPLWLVVKNDAKWKTLEDFVQDAKKNAGEISIGTYGSLSAADFLVQSFSKVANIKVINTPFKSTPDALTNVLGGHVDAALVTGGGGLLGGGKLRILALAQKTRLKSHPDVPTFTEEGYPISVKFCYTFAVRKDTPKDVVDRLYQAQKVAMENDPEKIERVFQNADLEAHLGTPEETMTLYKENRALFSRLVDEMRAPAK